MSKGKTMDKSFRKNFIIISLFCIVLPSAFLFSGSDEELFLRGNNYYAKQDYDNSLESYGMISKKGRAVLYNMGNCFYQKNDYAQALVYWNRAEIGATASECNSIARNKKYVLKKMGKSIDESFFQRIETFFIGKIMHVSLLFLQIFFLLSWLLFVLLLRKKKSHCVKMLLCCLAVLMMLTAIAMGVAHRHFSVGRAIVMRKEASLFSAPHKGLHVLACLPYADTVVVKESRQGWHKIRYADIIGWVEADVIQII